MSINRQLLGALFGHRVTPGGEVVVTTNRGVDIPLANASDAWTVIELTRTLAQIDRLPETQERT